MMTRREGEAPAEPQALCDPRLGRSLALPKPMRYAVVVTESQNNAPDPHRALSGRWLVVLTLSLFLLVPAVTYLAWQMTRGEPPRLELDYDERESWFMQPVSPRPLRYSTFVASETGKEYKKTDLTLPPETEHALQRCARLAQTEDFFEDTGARDELLKIAEDPQHGFYAPYLLASWYQANGEQGEHDHWISIAYDRADGALAQRLVDEEGGPVAGYTLPPIAIGYDRVIDGERNAMLVLIYPAPTSESNGFVYLPTFRSVYRLTDPALPPGADPSMHPIRLTLLPQPAIGRDQPNWFAVPDGAVGRFEDAVIPRSDRVIQGTIKTLQERVVPGRDPLLFDQDEQTGISDQ